MTNIELFEAVIEEHEESLDESDPRQEFNIIARNENHCIDIARNKGIQHHRHLMSLKNTRKVLTIPTPGRNSTFNIMRSKTFTFTKSSPEQ